MNLKLYSTKDYEKEPRLPITEKQTQSNPISKANKASCGSPSPAGGALLIDKPLLNTDEGQEDKAIAKSADHALASLGGGWICNLRRTVDQLVVRDYHFSIMAKIIYGVAGEGFGHSSRSHLIGQRLIDAGHDVMFVGYDKSLRYLKQYFGERVRQIFGLSFAYEDGRIDKSETLKLNLLNLSEGNRQNDELFKKYFEPFGPDLVISDFEPFSAWWAWRNQVPFISIDHEHMLTLCELEHRYENWFSRLTSSIVTRCYYVGAVAYVIINFFRTPLRIDEAVLAPPVVRPIVTGLEPGQGEHVLVYTTSGKGQDELRAVLGKFPRQRFHVYGFNESAECENCVFKERSTEGFLADLAGARGVVASAGFSLISECLCLKKKMLVLPVAGQYEQIINAHYVEKLGLGISAERLEDGTLGRFLNQLDEPMPDDERILWPDNNRFFEILQEVFHRLQKPISIIGC